jgi:flagellar export protein FliJ
MTSFSALIRLHKWQLDERQRQVVELETLLQGLQAEKERLASELLEEQRIAMENPDGAFGYANYAQMVVDRRRTLDQSIGEVEQEIAQARDELAEAFAELKKYELAAEAAARRAEAQEARRQQIQLDEMALSVFRRKSTRS